MPVILALLVGLSASLLPAAVPVAAAAVVAEDGFNRTVANGWGTAELGGPWAIEGPAAAFQVDGSRGVMNLGAGGANRAATLGVSLRDVDLSIVMSVEKTPAGAAAFAYADLRRSGDRSYRVRVRFAPDGGARLGLSQVVGGVETTLGSEVSLGLSHTGGSRIRVRGQVEGASPATLRARAWADGAAEPAGWSVTATDGTDSLQTAGRIGLRAYLSRSATNPPNAIRFDELAVSDLAANPPPTTEEFAADTFTRTVATGWGSSQTGGAWSVAGGTTGYRVDGSTGVMTLADAGANRAAWLPAANRRDVSSIVSVAVDRVPTAASAWAYVELRRVSDTAAYRLKLRLAPNGAAYAGLSRVSGAETDLVPEILLPGVTVSPGVRVWIRAEAIGAAPTTLRVRAWRDGQAEPATWALTTTDSTAALQLAAPIGFRAYLSRSATNSPIAVRFDDLRATDLAPPAPGDAVLVGAGDIGVCGSTRDEATADLLDGIPGTVFAAGDTVYENGTPAEYANCYEPSWGRHRWRTRPATGNHEYNTPGAAGYFGYFGTAAGDTDEGWYAFDLGSWRVYMLNSNCNLVGGCGPGSPQLAWLQADLAANTRTCAAAIWHAPRFTSGDHGNSTDVAPLWEAILAAGGEFVISGHDHDYERFAPMNGTGGLDTAAGVRQFVVGTGGVGLRPFLTIKPNSEARSSTAHGVLKLTLRASGYDWQFVPAAGATFTDSGSGTCH